MTASLSTSRIQQGITILTGVRDSLGRAERGEITADRIRTYARDLVAQIDQVLTNIPTGEAEAIARDLRVVRDGINDATGYAMSLSAGDVQRRAEELRRRLDGVLLQAQELVDGARPTPAYERLPRADFARANSAAPVASAPVAPQGASTEGRTVPAVVNGQVTTAQLVTVGGVEMVIVNS